MRTRELVRRIRRAETLADWVALEIPDYLKRVGDTKPGSAHRLRQRLASLAAVQQELANAVLGRPPAPVLEAVMTLELAVRQVWLRLYLNPLDWDILDCLRRSSQQRFGALIEADIIRRVPGEPLNLTAGLFSLRQFQLIEDAPALNGKAYRITPDGEALLASRRSLKPQATDNPPVAFSFYA